MTRVQASATGHQKTHQAVARAAQSCDAAVALALPDDQKHAAAKAVTMPVPGASISIIGDKTTTFDWPFKSDKRLITTDKEPSSIKGIDLHAGDSELVQLGALEGTISTKYAASTTSSISSFDNPASSGAESEVRAILGHAPLPPSPPSCPGAIQNPLLLSLNREALALSKRSKARADSKPPAAHRCRRR